MIRTVSKEDIPRCVQLIRESFGTVASELGFTEENAPGFVAFAMTQQQLERQLCNEKRPMFVWLEDGEPVGFYSLQPMEDAACELNNLCVHPQHRHKRIGGMLLEDAFAQARQLGCSVMKIGIVEENRRLRSWYEDYGFVHTGTQKFDFFPFTCGYMEKAL